MFSIPNFSYIPRKVLTIAFLKLFILFSVLTYHFSCNSYIAHQNKLFNIINSIPVGFITVIVVLVVKGVLVALENILEYTGLFLATITMTAGHYWHLVRRSEEN